LRDGGRVADGLLRGRGYENGKLAACNTFSGSIWKRCPESGATFDSL
jgi:hypothetical protein